MNSIDSSSMSSSTLSEKTSMDVFQFFRCCALVSMRLEVRGFMDDAVSDDAAAAEQALNLIRSTNEQLTMPESQFSPSPFHNNLESGENSSQDSSALYSNNSSNLDDSRNFRESSFSAQLQAKNFLVRSWIKFTLYITATQIQFGYGNMNIDFALSTGILTVLNFFLLLQLCFLTHAKKNIHWFNFGWVLWVAYFGLQAVDMTVSPSFKKYFRSPKKWLTILLNLASFISLACLTPQYRANEDFQYTRAMVAYLVVSLARFHQIFFLFNDVQVFEHIYPLLLRTAFIYFSFVYCFAVFAYSFFCNSLSVEDAQNTTADNDASIWTNYSNVLNFSTMWHSIYTMFELSLLGNWSIVMSAAAASSDQVSAYLFFYGYRLLTTLCVLPILLSFIIQAFLSIITRREQEKQLNQALDELEKQELEQEHALEQEQEDASHELSGASGASLMSAVESDDQELVSSTLREFKAQQFRRQSAMQRRESAMRRQSVMQMRRRYSIDRIIDRKTDFKLEDNNNISEVIIQTARTKRKSQQQSISAAQVSSIRSLLHSMFPGIVQQQETSTSNSNIEMQSTSSSRSSREKTSVRSPVRPAATGPHTNAAGNQSSESAGKGFRFGLSTPRKRTYSIARALAAERSQGNEIANATANGVQVHYDNTTASLMNIWDPERKTSTGSNANNYAFNSAKSNPATSTSTSNTNASELAAEITRLRAQLEATQLQLQQAQQAQPMTQAQVQHPAPRTAAASLFSQLGTITDAGEDEEEETDGAGH